jgi:hypothetical protein
VRGFAIALIRGCSGQDPFVIAIAMVKSGTVVTEEKPMATLPSREFPMSATRSACTA